MKKNKKLLVILTAILMAVFFLAAGCAAGDYAEVSDSAGKPAEETNPSAAALQTDATGRLIIYEYSCVIVTQNLAASVKLIADKFSAYSGYIESSVSDLESRTYNGRAQISANYNFRIKSAFYEDFISDLSAAGEVSQEKRSTSDVTESYFDLSAYKAAKQAEEARILALFEKAQTLSEITYLSSELSKVQHQLNNINSDLSAYDSKLEYCSVRVDFIQYTDEAAGSAFWNQIGDTFVSAGKGFVVFMQYILIILIYISPFGIVALLIIFFVRKNAKKRKAQTNSLRERQYNSNPPQNSANNANNANNTNNDAGKNAYPIDISDN